MGLLSTVPSGGETEGGDTSTEETGAEEQEIAAPETPEAPAPVPLPAPKGRRAKAAAEQQAMADRLKEFDEKLTRSTGEYQRQLAERDQEIARLKGSFETYQRVAQQQAQSPRVSAQDLHNKALDALKEGRFDEYDKYNRQSILAEMEEKRPAQQAQVQQQPQGMDPRMQMVVMSSPAAQKVLTHQHGMQMAVLADQELANVYNIPDGPDRWRKAFELAEQRLGGGQRTNGFPASGRQVLAGVAHSGNGTPGGKASPQVQLPAGWEKWAAGAGMTKEEYIRSYAEIHPDKVSGDE